MCVMAACWFLSDAKLLIIIRPYKDKKEYLNSTELSGVLTLHSPVSRLISHQKLSDMHDNGCL